MPESSSAGDGHVESHLEMRTSHKGVVDHAKGVLKRWPLFVGNAVAVFGVIWTLAATGSYFLNADFRGVRFYGVAVAFALVAAGVRTVRAYLNESPPGFEGEPASVRRIAHLQRSGWEFRLARELLQNALADPDDELSALSSGRVFVRVERQLDLQDYIDWVSLAPANLLSMMKVAQNLLVLDFAAALGTPELDARPLAISSVVRRIRHLYLESVAFEQSMQAVQPPEGAEKLHELQSGWSEPIRSGVRQLFDFLDRVLAVDKKDKHAQVEFTVVIDSPENIDQFCEELALIQARWLQT
jgi:hypothetical protein